MTELKKDKYQRYAEEHNITRKEAKERMIKDLYTPPFKSACRKGCAYSCVNKAIFLFDKYQVKQLRQFAYGHDLMPEFEAQYLLMNECESIEEVRELRRTCPFSTGAPDHLCVVHDFEKPHGCAVWESPDVELCKDPTRFPEVLAIALNNRMPAAFNCVVELRAAMCDKPDNLKLTYGPFIDDRRIQLGIFPGVIFGSVEQDIICCIRREVEDTSIEKAGLPATVATGYGDTRFEAYQDLLENEAK